MLNKLKQERIELLHELSQLPMCEYDGTSSVEDKKRREIGKKLDRNLIEMRKVKGIPLMFGRSSKITDEMRMNMIDDRLDGMTVKQMAEKYKISISTVKRYTSEALREMKQ